MAYPPIQIVDAHDQPLRGSSMDEAHREGLIHRIVYIFVEDGQGNVLLQKRGPGVAIYKGCWDVSASGHVDEGESYYHAAVRELKEEIGIEATLSEVGYYYLETRIDWRQLKRFSTVYKAEIPADTQFHLEPDEVTEVRWMSIADVRALIAEHPNQVASGLREGFQQFYGL